MKNTSDEFEFKEINYPSCKQLFTAFLREAAKQNNQRGNKLFYNHLIRS